MWYYAVQDDSNIQLCKWNSIEWPIMAAQYFLLWRTNWFKSEDETMASEHSDKRNWGLLPCIASISFLYIWDIIQHCLSSQFPWCGSVSRRSVSQTNLRLTSAWCSSFWWSKSTHSSARCMMSFSLVSGGTSSPVDSVKQNLKGLHLFVKIFYNLSAFSSDR